MDTSKPDMTTSISPKFKLMQDVSNITAFNVDEFSTWRSAFRECCKLASAVIDRQKQEIAKLHRQEDTKIPTSLKFNQIQGLSNEVKQKLFDIKPETLAQASRIPGITPAAISILLVYLKKHSEKKTA